MSEMSAASHLWNDAVAAVEQLTAAVVDLAIGAVLDVEPAHAAPIGHALALAHDLSNHALPTQP
jgi:hypothetical protein